MNYARQLKIKKKLEIDGLGTFSLVSFRKKSHPFRSKNGKYKFKPMKVLRVSFKPSEGLKKYLSTP